MEVQSTQVHLKVIPGVKMKTKQITIIRRSMLDESIYEEHCLGRNIECYDDKVLAGCPSLTAGRIIGFRSRFSQCVDYMRFNEKSFCFRWQETTKLMLFGNTNTSSLVILCDLRYLTGNISSVMTKHMGVQRKLHRFAYLIVQIILCF